MNKFEELRMSEWFKKKVFEEYILPNYESTIQESINLIKYFKRFGIAFETISKFKGYRASNIEVTKHLLDTETWTAALIDRRSEWIASQALIYWKRELPKAGPNQISAFNGR